MTSPTHCGLDSAQAVLPVVCPSREEPASFRSPTPLYAAFDNPEGASLMTATTDPDDRDLCRHCPASREGCEARKAARFGRCCSRCSHASPNPDRPVFDFNLTAAS